MLIPTIVLRSVDFGGRCTLPTMIIIFLSIFHSSVGFTVRPGLCIKSTATQLQPILHPNQQLNDGARIPLCRSHRNIEMKLSSQHKYALPTLYSGIAVILSGATFKMSKVVGWPSASSFGATAIFGWLCVKIGDKIKTRKRQGALSRRYKEIRMTNGTIDEIILDVAKQAGLHRAPKSYLIPSGETKPDVFVVGNLNRHSSQPPYLFLSQDLLNKFSEFELRAVVARECARLLYRDTIVKEHFSAIGTALDCTWALSLILFFRAIWQRREFERLLRQVELLKKNKGSRIKALWKHIYRILFRRGEEAAKSSVYFVRSLKTGKKVMISSAVLTKARDQLHASAGVWVIALLGTSFVALLGGLVAREVSRSAEYRADAFAAELIGYSPTITMLKKIDVLCRLKSWYFRENDNSRSKRKDTMQPLEEDKIPAAAVTRSPVGALIKNIKDKIAYLCSTQPTLENRIQALTKSEKEAKAKKL